LGFEASELNYEKSLGFVLVKRFLRGSLEKRMR
jgi:hypothetical protein